MSSCDHDCASCAQAGECELPHTEKTHELSRIKRVVAVVSGKGGVGKSAVTALLTAAMSKKGYRCAVLDADVTAPSIPKMFGVSGGVAGDETGIYPVKSKSGVGIMSSNLLLENETDPVVWRGPIIAGMVKQFWTDVVWGDVDYMFIDCPPGTGDVPLTVFQSIKVDGIIVVTTPQELVSMIVEKAVKMANMMKIPVIGLVENMSYVVCPGCGDKIDIFGSGKTEKTAEKFGLPLLAKLPYDRIIADSSDRGDIENADVHYLDVAADIIESGLPVNIDGK